MVGVVYDAFNLNHESCFLFHIYLISHVFCLCFIDFSLRFFSTLAGYYEFNMMLIYSTLDIYDFIAWHSSFGCVQSLQLRFVGAIKSEFYCFSSHEIEPNRTEQNRTTISVGHIILPTYNEQNENIQQEKVILFKLKCMNNRYYGQFICEIFGKGVISLWYCPKWFSTIFGLLACSKSAC